LDSPFNPYREWLRIPDGQRPANYYALFCLPAFEEDVDTIARAADNLRVLVRRIQPGEHVGQWERLLDEIAAGRACLTNPQTKAAYDATMRSTPVMLRQTPQAPPPAAAQDALPSEGQPRPLGPSHAAPPPPPSVAPHGHAVPPPPPPTRPIVVPPAPPPEAGRMPVPSVVSQAPPVRPVKASPLLVAKSSEVRPLAEAVPWHQGPLGYAVAFAILIVLGVAAYVVTPLLVPPAGQATDVAQSPGPAEPVSPEAAEGLTRSTPATKKPGAVDAEPKAAAPNLDTSSPTAPSADPMSGGAMSSDPMSGGMANAPAASENPTEMASLPPQTDRADEEKQAQFRKTMIECRAAWANRKLSDGQQLLEHAKTLARSDDEKDLVRRCENLNDWLGQFWKMIRQRISTLRAADEIELPKTRIVVVEVVGDVFTFKDEGRVQKYAVDELPGPVVIGLADAWLAKDPATQMIFGAYLALDREGDPPRAAQLWREAGNAGQPVDKLVPDLSLVPYTPPKPEPKPQPAEARAVPKPEAKPTPKPEAKPSPKPAEPKAEAKKPPKSEDDSKPGAKKRAKAAQAAKAVKRLPKPTDPAKLQQAEKTLQERFAAQLEGAAASLLKKSEAAKALLAAAREPGDPEVTYALLGKALELAIACGKVDLTWEIVDQTAETFEVDPWVMKTEAIEQWDAVARNAETARKLIMCREVTVKGLKLIEEAVAEGRRPEAIRMAKAVAEMAQFTQNPVLIKQVAGVVAELTGSAGKEAKKPE